MFRYDLDNGETFHGKTLYLFKDIYSPHEHFNLFLDPNGDICWVSFGESDLNSTETFVKFARPGAVFCIFMKQIDRNKCVL